MATPRRVKPYCGQAQCEGHNADNGDGSDQPRVQQRKTDADGEDIDTGRQHIGKTQAEQVAQQRHQALEHTEERGHFEGVAQAQRFHRQAAGYRDGDRSHGQTDSGQQCGCVKHLKGKRVDIVADR